MVFVNSSGPIPGINMGFPDVCLTPIVVPVPIPYPNMCMSPTAIPTQFKVLLMCMPAHNLTTTRVPSLGDQAGVNLGVASGMVMGPDRHMMGSTVLLIGGPPCTKMLDPTGHNGMSPNVPGVTISPSQPKILCLR